MTALDPETPKGGGDIDNTEDDMLGCWLERTKVGLPVDNDRFVEYLMADEVPLRDEGEYVKLELNDGLRCAESDCVENEEVPLFVSEGGLFMLVIELPLEASCTTSLVVGMELSSEIASVPETSVELETAVDDAGSWRTGSVVGVREEESALLLECPDRLEF